MDDAATHSVAWHEVDCSRADLRAAELALCSAASSQRHRFTLCRQESTSQQQKLLAYAYNIVARAALGLLLAFALGFLFDVIYLQDPDWSTAIVAGVGALMAVPILTFLALLRKGERSKYTVKACECVFYLLFTWATYWVAQSSFDVGNRYAFRTRLYNMLNDEFFQSSTEEIPLVLERIDSVPELYEWLRGPMADHFLCPTPPINLTSLDKSHHEVCYLPDGAFVSDGLFEIRTVRMIPEDESPKLSYFTSADQGVTVGGEFVQWGRSLRARDREDKAPWQLGPLLLRHENMGYRTAQLHNATGFIRYGWHDRYQFGGYRVALGSEGPAAAIETVSTMEEYGFIDRFTRGVEVRASVGNPANGLWAFVTILIETPEEGVLRISPEVLVMRKLSERAQGLQGKLDDHALLILLALTFYHLLAEMERMAEKGLAAYIRHLSFITEWAIIVVGGFTSLTILRTYYYFPDLTQADAREQVMRSGYTVNYIMQRSSTMLGLLLWLQILKAFKYIKVLFKKGSFGLLSATLQNAFVDLSIFFLLAMVAMLSFAFLFHFSVGIYLREFATLGHSAYSVLLGLATLWDPQGWYEYDPVTAAILVLIFTMGCTWVLSTMVIAIITEAFVTAKQELAIRRLASEQEIQRKQAKLLAWVADGASDRLPGAAHLARHNTVRTGAGPMAKQDADGRREDALAPAGASASAGGRSGCDALSPLPAVADGQGAPDSVQIGRQRGTSGLGLLARAATSRVLFRQGSHGRPELDGFMVKLALWNASNVLDVGNEVDSHVKMHIVHQGAIWRKALLKSKTVRGSREPDWSSPFVLLVPALDSRLVLSVHSADDMLAYIVVPLAPLGEQLGVARTIEYELKTSLSQMRKLKARSLFTRVDEPAPVKLRLSLALHEHRRPQGPKTARPTLGSRTQRESQGRLSTFPQPNGIAQGPMRT